MSQFITLPKTVPLQSPVILKGKILSLFKGIMSKVVQPTTQRKSLSTIAQRNNPFSSSTANLTSQTQSFYQMSQDKRFVQQLKLADELQNVVIGREYQKMKKNLLKYGKSMSLKVENIVRHDHHQRYFEPLQLQHGHRQSSKHNPSIKPTGADIIAIIAHQQKQAKQRYSMGNIHSQISSHDRIVFVDRKYNNEFSIKYSSLKQAEEIDQMKNGYKKFLSKYKMKSPLVQIANGEIKRRKYFSSYTKEPIEGVIGKVEGVEGYKARRKQRPVYEGLVVKENIQEMEGVLTRACSGHKERRFIDKGVKKLDKLESGMMLGLRKQKGEGQPIMRKKQKTVKWEKIARRFGERKVE